MERWLSFSVAVKLDKTFHHGKLNLEHVECDTLRYSSSISVHGDREEWRRSCIGVAIRCNGYRHSREQQNIERRGGVDFQAELFGKAIRNTAWNHRKYLIVDVEKSTLLGLPDRAARSVSNNVSEVILRMDFHFPRPNE